MGARLLIDSSAWARISLNVLAPERAGEIANKILDRTIAIALPFLLEAGYTARNAAEHGSIVKELMRLPWLEIDERVEKRAVAAQAQLARAGHHRLPPLDLVSAAIAERHEVGVLHYDADFDVIRERTGLRFESVWLAERGSL